MHKIAELDNLYIGETLWVIGRGPSLERLTALDIGQGPVIAINQAISKVEDLNLENPLYSMQKDRFFLHPQHAVVLAHARESALNHREEIERAGAYVFDCPDDFGYPWDIPSVVVCIGLALRWACAQVVYLCCDAVTDKDIRAYGEQPAYPSNYLLHGPLVMRYSRLMPVEYKRI